MRRRATSVPLLSDRAIEKFPRFFAHEHLGGASRSLIGPGRLVILARRWRERGCTDSLSLVPVRSRPLTLTPSPSHPSTTPRQGYLSRLQILTSYRYRGHSSILYSPCCLSLSSFLPSSLPPSLSIFHLPFSFRSPPLRVLAGSARFVANFG